MAGPTKKPGTNNMAGPNPQTRRIDLHQLTGGRAITTCDQHEVLRDLIAAADGGRNVGFAEFLVAERHNQTSSLANFRTWAVLGGCSVYSRSLDETRIKNAAPAATIVWAKP